MVSGNAENKSAFENGIFLKVDSVEPVYHEGYSPFDFTRLSGIKVWIGNTGHFFPCDRYTVCDPDVAREDGRSQVVALAKELGEMKFADRNELFGNYTIPDILNHRSYEQIVEKLDTWKKEKNEIRVRDEVVNVSTGVKIVVTAPPEMSSNSVKYMSGISKDGRVYEDVVASAYKKTGLHVDDLDAYLEV